MSADEPDQLSSSAVQRASADYCSNWPLRMLIQAIPIVGGPLDTLLSGTGANYQYHRIEQFLKELQERLSVVDRVITGNSLQPSEPLYDYMLQVFDGVRRTRSAEKRHRFVNIVTRQVCERLPWNEAEAAASLLNSLSELQVQILVHAQKLSPCRAIGGNKRVFTLSAQPFRSAGEAAPKLQSAFPDVPEAALRAACSELIARGLLYDEGIGRLDVRAQEYFEFTDFAEWFLSWITAFNSSSHPSETSE